MKLMNLIQRNLVWLGTFLACLASYGQDYRDPQVMQEKAARYLQPGGPIPDPDPYSDGRTPAEKYLAAVGDPAKVNLLKYLRLQAWSVLNPWYSLKQAAVNCGAVAGYHDAGRATTTQLVVAGGAYALALGATAVGLRGVLNLGPAGRVLSRALSPSQATATIALGESAPAAARGMGTAAAARSGSAALISVVDAETAQGRTRLVCVTMMRRLLLFSDASDSEALAAAMRCKPSKGFFDVFAHGNIGAFKAGTPNGGYTYLNPLQLASLIRRAGWQGEDLRLLACHLGDDYAREVARCLGIKRVIKNVSGEELHLLPQGGFAPGTELMVVRLHP